MRAASQLSVRRAMMDQCKAKAIRLAGKTRFDGELPVVEMPPTAMAGDDGARRRLAALEAIDVLAAQLKRASYRAELYFQVGWIYLRSLENPAEAARYLCRALVLEPRVRRYELAVLTAWMGPGAEPELELALRPGERSLPWRAALKEARTLTGVSWEQRAGAFDEGVSAQRIVRNNRLMQRVRLSGRIEALADVLRAWVEPGGDVVRLVVSFPQRYQKRNRSLRKRGEVADERVWSMPGPGPRGVVFGRGEAAVGPVLQYAASVMRRVRVGVSLRQGERRLYLIGRLEGEAMKVQAIAARPDAPAVREAARDD